ncbi:MAG TPA: 4'-phosphopantetheinyl transferase superfamily protein [Terriglobales bacterium]|nr:4'-phosphopantetheinyl transferase superfamily protein [Terriglobales bacterium]
MNFKNVSSAASEIAAPLDLAENEVHLWRLDLSAAAASEERWQQILSADERARAARFRFSRDRQFFAATRAVLRTILGSYVASDPKSLAFNYAEKGKPSLVENDLAQGHARSRQRLEFNVSHSGTTALLAFARGRALGVDVEQIRDDRDAEAVAQRFFSQREQIELASFPASDTLRGFFRCWTRKEAFIKARGEGLSIPLSDFDVSIKAGDENALLATRPDPAEVARWSLREVPGGDGYEAALCVEGRGWNLKCLVC